MRESRTYGSVRGACDETHVPCTLQIAWRITTLLSSEENGEPLSSLWQVSPCGRLGPVFQAPLSRLNGILGRA
jgi:hypothetical protein